MGWVYRMPNEAWEIEEEGTPTAWSQTLSSYCSRCFWRLPPNFILQLRAEIVLRYITLRVSFLRRQHTHIKHRCSHRNNSSILTLRSHKLHLWERDTALCGIFLKIIINGVCGVTEVLEEVAQRSSRALWEYGFWKLMMTLTHRVWLKHYIGNVMSRNIGLNLHEIWLQISRNGLNILL